MPQRRIKAAFMRGGTSKAVVFRRDDLPENQADWAPIFLGLMGSPDPNGRQLDGMGGGLSSLSKICVVGPSSRPDADVDYTFAQISVDKPVVDYSGNCGNMSSAIGPFAVDSGLVPRPSGDMASVRIHNTNTTKVIVSRFPVADGVAEVEGDMALDGIAGTGAPIRLEFLEPGGSKTGKLLPSGHAVDRLDVPGMGSVEASLVDAANPCLFVRAADLDKCGTESPAELDADSRFVERMEAIRRAGSVAMGIAADLDAASNIPSIPKIGIVAAPTEASTVSGRVIGGGEMDILVRMISVGQAHRAVPVTAALCIAVAARIPGSIPNAVARLSNQPIRIAQPSGVTVVDADVIASPDGTVHARHGAVYRTARLLFDGEVLYRERRPD